MYVFDGIHVIFTAMIGFVTWPTFTDRQERWPSEPSNGRSLINNKVFNHYVYCQHCTINDETFKGENFCDLLDTLIM